MERKKVIITEWGKTCFEDVYSGAARPLNTRLKCRLMAEAIKTRFSKPGDNRQVLFEGSSYLPNMPKGCYMTSNLEVFWNAYGLYHANPRAKSICEMNWSKYINLNHSSFE